MLEVEYQLTEADLRQAMRAFPLRLRLTRTAALWGIMLTAALPATLLLAAFGNIGALVGGWVCWCLGACALWYRMWSTQRRSIAAAANRQATATTRITPEWIKSTKLGCEIRTDWEEMEHVIVTPELVLMVSKTLVFHVVPRRAFSDLAAAETFARFAMQYHRAAQDKESPRLAPSAPDVTDDDSMQVFYCNRAEELVSVEFDGLRKPDQTHASTMSWPRAVGMMLIGVALATFGSMRSGEGLWEKIAQVICGSMGMLLCAVGMLIAINPLLRLISRSRNEKRCGTDLLVTISSRGVEAVGEHHQSEARWTEYSSIEDDERFIAFYQNDRTHLAHLVPKRAFASAAEAERFVSLARQHWQAVQLPPEAQHETGNPYQSPAAPPN